MKKNLAITMLAAFILVTGAVALLGQAPVSEKLASGSYVVYAQSPQIWRVKVDPKTMGNVTIAGHFTVTDGSPKTIDVLVFNEQNYMKWKDEDDAVRAGGKPLSSVMQKAEGDISAKLADAGFAYLVISNRHEYEGKKTVVADIKLQYDKH